MVESVVVAKWFLYCSRAAKNETIKIKSKYQKFMAVSTPVLLILSVSHPHAISLVSGSGNIVIMIDRPKRKSTKRKKMAVAKTPLCAEATKDGINAWVKAPSAKIRRKRLGSLNATINMSNQTEAPSAEVIRMSRTNPVILESSIPKLLVKIDFKRIMLFNFKLHVLYPKGDIEIKYVNLQYFYSFSQTLDILC